MKAWPEKAMTASALLLTLVFLLGVSAPEALWNSRQDRETANNPPYHAGKSESLPGQDPSCQSEKCHPLFPHRKDRTESVFRNMHRRTADCLSCHGKESSRHLEVGAHPERKGWRITYSKPSSNGDPHVGLQRNVSCRKCHSEAGMRMLAEKGGAGLPHGFADPIALRMIEGGTRRWVPSELR